MGISDDQWEEITKRLVIYTHLKTNFSPNPKNRETLICSKSPKDIAFEAISKFLTGERKWNPQKVPDILYFLKRVVDSILSHMYESKQHSQQNNLEYENGYGEGKKYFDKELSKEPTPDFLLEEKDLKDLLIKKSENDDEMQLVLLSLFEGNKAKEISKDLGIPISQVYNILKRIRRIKL